MIWGEKIVDIRTRNDLEKETPLFCHTLASPAPSSCHHQYYIHYATINSTQPIFNPQLQVQHCDHPLQSTRPQTPYIVPPVLVYTYSALRILPSTTPKCNQSDVQYARPTIFLCMDVNGTHFISPCPTSLRLCLLPDKLFSSRRTRVSSLPHLAFLYTSSSHYQNDPSSVPFSIPAIHSCHISPGVLKHVIFVLASSRVELDRSSTVISFLYSMSFVYCPYDTHAPLDIPTVHSNHVPMYRRFRLSHFLM